MISLVNTTSLSNSLLYQYISISVYQFLTGNCSLLITSYYIINTIGRVSLESVIVSLGSSFWIIITDKITSYCKCFILIVAKSRILLIISDIKMVVWKLFNMLLVSISKSSKSYYYLLGQSSYIIFFD